MFDHIQIKVANLQKSRAFYETTLATLGYTVVLDIKDVVVGIGKDVHNMIEFRQASESAPLSQFVHVAFVAEDQEAVKHFHAIALENGAKDNGTPGLRDYEEGYFAAFVIDPNGHNLEAVFSQKQT